MEELKKICRTLSKNDDSAPHEVLLVVDATTGSNALSGTSLSWTFTASGSDGAAQVEEAGDDNTLSGTDDDDFSNA